MLTGRVNVNGEATVRLSMSGPGGARVVECIIDTGFTAYLTLPPDLISALRLMRIGRGRALLANGSEDIFDLYEVTVEWMDEEVLVEADEADTDPLIGVALLHGHDLYVKFVEGGDVSIE